jgi:ABC-type bacteriocin/lantibiotic exporter with double-glycine peptidase domain
VASGRPVLLVVCALTVSACSTTVRTDRYVQQIDQGEAIAVPYVRQASRVDCGMAALASVMEYYKGPAYLQRVWLERYPPASSRGYSLGELRDIARAHDFAGFVVPGNEALLREQLSRGRPMIVPLQLQGAVPLIDRTLDTRYDHYVVVVGMDDERGKVVTMDPARGPVQLDFDDFAAGWEAMNRAVLLVGLASHSD